MSGSANVRSIDALMEFKATLLSYRKKSQDALDQVSSDARRFLEWITYEQPSNWKRETRRRHEKLLEAKSELVRKRATKIGGIIPDCTEQQMAVKKAQRAVYEGEEKVKNCKRWAVEFERAIDEYEGIAKRLSGMLDSDLIRAAELLKRLSEVLEAYVQIAPPSSRPVVSTAMIQEAATVAQPPREVEVETKTEQEESRPQEEQQ